MARYDIGEAGQGSRNTKHNLPRSGPQTKQQPGRTSTLIECVVVYLCFCRVLFMLIWCVYSYAFREYARPRARVTETIGTRALVMRRGCVSDTHTHIERRKTSQKKIQQTKHKALVRTRKDRRAGFGVYAFFDAIKERRTVCLVLPETMYPKRCIGLQLSALLCVLLLWWCPSSSFASHVCRRRTSLPLSNLKIPT